MQEVTTNPKVSFPENNDSSSLSTIGIPNYILQDFVNYFVVAYVVLSIFWFVNFFYTKVKCSSESDSLFALHNATYDNETYLALEIMKHCPEAINKTLYCDKEKYTPFLRACLNGNTVLVEAMIKLGADIKAKTARNENGFYLAVYDRIKNRHSKDGTCIRLLYKSGVDINEPNCNGLNAIQLAARFGHASLVQWLLSKNANADVEPSPLLIANIFGQRSSARVFKEFEAGN